MNYHNITTDDMLNGPGLRTVLWVAGCSHGCKGCHNRITWDPNGGLLFDEKAEQELFEKADKDYISGLTLSGGDPLYKQNMVDVLYLIKRFKERFPNKTIWVYTGYTWEQIMNMHDSTRWLILKEIDVLVDGKFIQELKDNNYHWAGSTNQRVIDVQRSLRENKVIEISE